MRVGLGEIAKNGNGNKKRFREFREAESVSASRLSTK